VKKYTIGEVANELKVSHWIVRYWFDHLYKRVGRPRNRKTYQRRLLTSRDFEMAKQAIASKPSYREHKPTALVCGGNNFTAITVEMRKAFQNVLDVKAVSLNALQEVAQSCRPCCIIIDAAATTRGMVLKVVREIQSQSWGRGIEIHSLFTTRDESLRAATHTTRSGLIKELKSQFQVNS